MMPAIEYQILAASAIDLDDPTYFLAPEKTGPPPLLVESIRKYGILHPPLVQLRGSDRVIVIAGWKRLETAITFLNLDSVSCIVAPADCPTRDIYELLLEQSLLSNPFSPVEQSTLFANLGASCAVEEILPFLAKLGYRPTRHQLDELLAIRNLSRSATLALHRGILSLANARKLLRVSPADQEILVALITRFRLSGSRQQKVIDLSTELLRREERSAEELIDPFLKKIDHSGQENIPQQAMALLSWLHEQSFPRSVRAESEFGRQVARLNLPSTMHVEHSPSFEDDSVSLVLKFGNWDALDNALPGIRQLLPAK